MSGILPINVRHTRSIRLFFNYFVVGKTLKSLKILKTLKILPKRPMKTEGVTRNAEETFSYIVLRIVFLRHHLKISQRFFPRRQRFPSPHHYRTTRIFLLGAGNAVIVLMHSKALRTNEKHRFDNIR
jgi:hypothetical protein